MPRRLVFARLALAALLLVVPGISRAQEDLDVERTVRNVDMHGNEAYGDGTLKDLLRTRGSSFWNPFKKHPLRADFIRSDRQTLATYYRRHGYLKAQIDSVIIVPVGTSSKSDVHFYLTEGPRTVVAEVTMEGLGPLSEAEFRKTLRYQAGSPLDMPIVEASRDSILYAYADRGYVLARVVDSLAVADDSVRVFYQIDPGPKVSLDQVLVEGTNRTKPSYVSREMLLKPGDTIRRSKLITSQQRIYDSGLYSDVQMSLEHPDTTTYRSDLVVSVREQKMGWIDAGIGYGTVDQIRLTGQWGQRNIFRTGMRFVATGRLGLLPKQDISQSAFGDRRIDLALTHPWPFGVKLQTTVGVYAEEQPIIQETDQFPLRAQGGSVVFASPFFRDVRSYLSYELRHTSYDSLSLSAGTGSYNTNRIAFTNEWDTRLDIFNPNHGQDVVGKIELVTGATPGANGFTNLGLQGTKYHTLYKRTVIAARVRGGYLEPWGPKPAPDPASDVPPELAQIPPDDRYRTGGASTVRGYLENELGSRQIPDTTAIEARGGQVLLLVSVELRVPLIWVLSGAAFFDGGNVWERPEDIKPSKIFSFAGGAGYNDMRYSGGLGLRIGTPIGPVRFDYGWKIRSPRTPYEPDLSPRRGEFHFSLGNAY